MIGSPTFYISLYWKLKTFCSLKLDKWSFSLGTVLSCFLLKPASACPHGCRRPACLFNPSPPPVCHRHFNSWFLPCYLRRRFWAVFYGKWSLCRVCWQRWVRCCWRKTLTAADTQEFPALHTIDWINTKYLFYTLSFVPLQIVIS